MTVNVQFVEDEAAVRVHFKEEDSFFKAEFGEEDATFKAVFGEVISVPTGGINPEEIPKYTGDYEVTPKVSKQTLHTAQKMMLDDVTINKIPYYETTNNSGGHTVYIASSVVPTLGTAILGKMRL